MNDDDILDYNNITIDTSALPSNTIPYNSYNVGTITGLGSNGTVYNFNTGNNIGISPSLTTNGGLKVSADAEFEGDVKIKGVSIAKVLEDIQQRLAILVPNSAKLEHFEALKKAYDHYKLLEALCELPTETKE